MKTSIYLLRTSSSPISSTWCLWIEMWALIEDGRTQKSAHSALNILFRFRYRSIRTLFTSPRERKSGFSRMTSSRSRNYTSDWICSGKVVKPLGILSRRASALGELILRENWGVIILIFSPMTCLNVYERVLTSLFTKLFTKAFTPYAYAASLAGLNWDIGVIRCGVQVRRYPEVLFVTQKLDERLRTAVIQL